MIFSPAFRVLRDFSPKSARIVQAAWRAKRIGLPHSTSRSSSGAKPGLAHEISAYSDRSIPEHHDLSSYEAYAQRTGLDTGSTVYVGTHYEYTVANELKRLGFRLERNGGAGDYGIDLLGEWSIPSNEKPLRVIVQCKVAAMKTAIGPKNIRELEGAFIGAPAGFRGPGVLGLLVTQKSSTNGIRASLARSRWPMGFICCLPDGQIHQMIWNARAEEEGLTGLGVGFSYSGDGLKHNQLVLTYKGEPV